MYNWNKYNVSILCYTCARARVCVWGRIWNINAFLRNLTSWHTHLLNLYFILRTDFFFVSRNLPGILYVKSSELASLFHLAIFCTVAILHEPQWRQITGTSKNSIFSPVMAVSGVKVGDGEGVNYSLMSTPATRGGILYTFSFFFFFVSFFYSLKTSPANLNITFQLQVWRNI